MTPKFPCMDSHQLALLQQLSTPDQPQSKSEKVEEATVVEQQEPNYGVLSRIMPFRRSIRETLITPLLCATEKVVEVIEAYVQPPTTEQGQNATQQDVQMSNEAATTEQKSTPALSSNSGLEHIPNYINNRNSAALTQNMMNELTKMEQSSEISEPLRTNQ